MPRSVNQARVLGSSSGTRTTRSALSASRSNKDQGGGPALAGLASSVGRGNFNLWNGLRRTSSTPEQRRQVFCINQLGGVGSGFYQTRSHSGGTKRVCKGSFTDLWTR